MEVYVLDNNLEIVGIIQGFTSLIWSERYREVGDCELYLPVSAEALSLLKIGRYIKRSDNYNVYIIKKLTIETDADNGDYITVTGWNAQSYLDQRIVLNTLTIKGSVSSALEQMVSNALGSSAETARRLKKANGNQLFYVLGSGLSGNDDAQITYNNIGETVRDYCTRYGWGYRCRFNNGGIAFQLYAGTDRSDNIIFSRDMDNLNTSQHVVDDTNLGNLALVAGEGEGADRKKVTVGTASGVYRYEVYVDARDVSSNITYEQLITAYPDGTISQQGGNYVYSIDGVVYATLPSASPQSNDTVVLSNTIYEQYLVARGTDKISGYGEKTTFNGAVIPYVQFKYNEDYFLGDIVTIKTQYGVTVKARIIEVVEAWDENGYSLEPKFEYLDIAVEPQYILTQDRQILLAQDGRGLMSQENARSGSVDGVKITELPSVSGLDSSQYFPVASVAETSKIDYDSLVDSITDDIPDASYSERGLVSTDEQFIKGRKTFTEGVMCLSNAEGTRYTEFDFRDVSFSADPTAASGARAAYIINQRPNAGSSVGNALALVLRSPLSDGTGYASGNEAYALPTATNDLSGTVLYDILTTKSPVAIEQGGTGATTLAGAQSALQIRPTYTFSISSTTPRSFIVPNNSRHMIVVVGSAANRHGLFLVNASSSGAIGLVEVYKGSGLTTSTATNTFSITSNGAATIMVITLSGSAVSV